MIVEALKKIHRAAETVQLHLRSWLKYRRSTIEQRRARKSAILIQKYCRGYLGRG